MKKIEKDKMKWRWRLWGVVICGLVFVSIL